MKKTISTLFAITIIIGCAAAAFLIVYNYDLIPRIGEEEPGEAILIPTPPKEIPPGGEEEESLSEKEQSCINSGGKVTTSICCKSTENFPDLCVRGTCDITVKNEDGTRTTYRSRCSPENSHKVKICDCDSDNKCFDGERCVALVAGTTVFCCGPKRLDLNSDGAEELIAFEGDRGASGNGPIFIYKEINGSRQQIGEMSGNLVWIEKEKTDEYYNISTQWHLGAGSGEFCDYKWDKKISYYYQVSCEVAEIGLP